jgi:hypothetical protein
LFEAAQTHRNDHKLHACVHPHSCSAPPETYSSTHDHPSKTPKHAIHSTLDAGLKGKSNAILFSSHLKSVANKEKSSPTEFLGVQCTEDAIDDPG